MNHTSGSRPGAELSAAAGAYLTYLLANAGASQYPACGDSHPVPSSAAVNARPGRLIGLFYTWIVGGVKDYCSGEFVIHLLLKTLDFLSRAEFYSLLFVHFHPWIESWG